jgi:hypothetical protein
MDGSLKADMKRQMIFLGASFAVGLLLTYFLGFYIGLALNMAIFVGAMFYIRWRRNKALKSLGFSDATIGRGAMNEGLKLKYICISCGFEVKGTRCGKCGSNMKKPLF